jgi:hypothetical protein
MGIPPLRHRIHFCAVREQRCHRKSLRLAVRTAITYFPTAHLLCREEVPRTFQRGRRTIRTLAFLSLPWVDHRSCHHDRV